VGGYCAPTVVDSVESGMWGIRAMNDLLYLVVNAVVGGILLGYAQDEWIAFHYPEASIDFMMLFVNLVIIAISIDHIANCNVSVKNNSP
jgi:hypothetical protein